MITTKPIISGVKDRCCQCGACVRVCPVKAIKIIGGQVEIVDSRCIYCGRCLKVCAPQAIVMRQDEAVVKEWLARDQVVAIVATEIYAAFPGLNIDSLKKALLGRGFYAVEESVLGEELVAKEYLTYIQSSTNFPIIRSTCAAIVEMIEKFYPDYIPNLAPIVSPMVAQSRLVKSLYPHSTKVVYIGPCIAKKSEQQKLPNGAVDAVLTFKELNSLMGRGGFPSDLNRQPDGGLCKYPMVTHNFSASDGFPRKILKNKSLTDNSLIVSWGADHSYKFMDQVSALNKSTRLIDLMACHGCIDGPVMETDIKLAKRKELAAEYYRQLPKRSIAFDSLNSSLSVVNINRSFSSRQVELPKPTTAQIAEILTAGGRESAADELNCGGCGYPTCREYAIAIFQGLTDWSMCFPYQKQLFFQSTQELKEISATDGLTELANHRSFQNKLKEEFKRARRYHSVLSLMMIDVDKFKYINDTYGHLEGDRLLKLIAELILHHLRDTDFAARYGGDEFAIILPQTTSKETLVAAEKLRSLIAGAAFFVGAVQDEKKENITLSIGICELNASDSDSHDLISRADKAMYRAKEGGRNQTIIAN